MKKPRKSTESGVLLDLWRSPREAGEPIGCLATTYTFMPGLFDEQCLARFLDIESEPDRENLPFLLERESRLGGVYAGVLVDQTQAGVEHSLRWDVLPVRIPSGKQHAKISLLAWAHHIRIIVASANLTEPGYRTNYEVAAAVDLKPDAADPAVLVDAVDFLRSLLAFVPGAAEDVQRAEAFLDRVTRRARDWKTPRKRDVSRQQLVFTLPGRGDGDEGRSSLDEAMDGCRKRGGAADSVWIASPFFDPDTDRYRATGRLCTLMARGVRREIVLCVPAIRDVEKTPRPRLAAPKSLLSTSVGYAKHVSVEMLPDQDTDRNPRYWHAKMMAFRTGRYSALMIGSSNFTAAGMGVGKSRHAEANLLTIVDRGSNKQGAEIERIWPEMEDVTDPESAEWAGPQPGNEEEEQARTVPPPAGFLSAIYRAGETRCVILRLDPGRLPDDWTVHACGCDGQELLSAAAWNDAGRSDITEISWTPIQPPEKLVVRWNEREAFLPLNVEDAGLLPPPAELENMTADDMLSILAAADPSAAFRVWARRRESSDTFDPELDSGTIDLDPLRRYDLQTTFLHRIRRRARVLAQMRANLQRPVWGAHTLEWRLRGLVGVEALAKRLAGECLQPDGAPDEALLTLADFLIVLQEVEYQAQEGSLGREEFEAVYRPFLKDLAESMRQRIASQNGRFSGELLSFWERVVQRCGVVSSV